MRYRYVLRHMTVSLTSDCLAGVAGHRTRARPDLGIN